MKLLDFPDSRKVNTSGATNLVIRWGLVKMVARLPIGSRVYFTDGTHVDVSGKFEELREKLNET